MEEAARRARAAAQVLAGTPTEKKNEALKAFKKALQARREEIEAANKQDKTDAEAAVKDGSLAASLYKRLDVCGTRFDNLLQGIDDVIRLPDPVGEVTYANAMSDADADSQALTLYRVTCPIGVLLIIFEARPEAAVQIASLAIKSGNALLLKGGREAQRSNAALVAAMAEALREAGLPEGCIAGIDTRTEVAELLRLDKYIDLVIPRGSNALVRSIKDASRIPVLGHADGICSVYVDEHADVDKAVRVCADSKTQYAAACNAMETLLVHEKVADSFLPKLAAALSECKDVQFRADAVCAKLLPAGCTELATEADYDEEFLCHTMAVRAVPSVEVAIEHINQHGSHHTDTVITEQSGVAEAFLRQVDSAGVFHNASTRFADGFRFGFGAEVGISTNRVHARGPVGLEGLVIYKYRLYGDGHTVADFSGPEPKRRFTHQRLNVTRVEDAMTRRWQ